MAEGFQGLAEALVSEGTSLLEACLEFIFVMLFAIGLVEPFV